PEYFDMIGVRPVLGRLLTRADTQGADGAPVVVISHRLWQRRFGGDPRVLGDRVTIDQTPLTIVGVLEPGFQGLQADSGVDLFMTIWRLRAMAGDPTRPLRAINGIARIGPGHDLAEARADLQARWPAWRAIEVPRLPAADQVAMRSQRLAVEPI